MWGKWKLTLISDNFLIFVVIKMVRLFCPPTFNKCISIRIRLYLIYGCRLFSFHCYGYLILFMYSYCSVIACHVFSESKYTLICLLIELIINLSQNSRTNSLDSDSIRTKSIDISLTRLSMLNLWTTILLMIASRRMLMTRRWRGWYCIRHERCPAFVNSIHDT